MKILYLNGGICPEVGLESSMEVAKGPPNMRDGFDKFTNHFTGNVTNRRSHLESLISVTQTRQVSANMVEVMIEVKKEATL